LKECDAKPLAYVLNTEYGSRVAGQIHGKNLLFVYALLELTER